MAGITATFIPIFTNLISDTFIPKTNGEILVAIPPAPPPPFTELTAAAAKAAAKLKVELEVWGRDWPNWVEVEGKEEGFCG